MECEKLTACSFVNCCKEMEKNNQAQGFINMYCKGDKMDTCIRKQLSAKFGKDVVPKNMMPNGYPVFGTNKDDWSEQALNYRHLL